MRKEGQGDRRRIYGEGKPRRANPIEMVDRPPIVGTAFAMWNVQALKSRFETSAAIAVVPEP